MIAEPVIERIENAVREVNLKLDKNDSIKGWKGLSENDLFTELASCILGSRITFEKAKQMSEALRRSDLLSLEYLLEEPWECENRIYSILKEYKCLYGRSKARYIVRSGLKIYLHEHTTIKGILRKASDQHAAREILSDLCLGIGLKQASLFLRNIHYADDLAILDSHVISYMHLIGLQDGEHKSLNRKMYISYEDTLRSYSMKFDSSMAQLDVSIWVVMRTISKEFKWML